MLQRDPHKCTSSALRTNLTNTNFKRTSLNQHEWSGGALQCSAEWSDTQKERSHVNAALVKSLLGNASGKSGLSLSGIDLLGRDMTRQTLVLFLIETSSFKLVFFSFLTSKFNKL